MAFSNPCYPHRPSLMPKIKPFSTTLKIPEFVGIKQPGYQPSYDSLKTPPSHTTIIIPGLAVVGHLAHQPSEVSNQDHCLLSTSPHSKVKECLQYAVFMYTQTVNILLREHVRSFYNISYVQSFALKYVLFHAPAQNHILDRHSWCLSHSLHTTPIW